VDVRDVGAVVEIRDDDLPDAPAEFLDGVEQQVVGERPADPLGVEATGDTDRLVEADEDGKQVVRSLTRSVPEPRSTTGTGPSGVPATLTPSMTAFMDMFGRARMKSLRSTGGWERS
jgi:hypothetical protein